MTMTYLNATPNSDANISKAAKAVALVIFIALGLLFVNDLINLKKDGRLIFDVPPGASFASSATQISPFI